MKVNLRLERFFENKEEDEFIPVQINIANNPAINRDLLDNIISTGSINNYTDEQLFMLLSNNLRGFLLNIFEQKDRRYIQMIISDRFLRVLIQVVNNIEIDYMNKIYINSLCYDYLVLDKKDQNNVITDLIYQLANIANKSHIPVLIAQGIHEKIASYIVLSRFSSNKEFVNIKRMNFTIMKNINFVFTEQMIVDIYQILFPRVTQLFEATMLDVIEDTDEPWYSNAIDERYSMISLALLDILESLTSEQIRRVLDDYVILYNLSYNGRPVRFDIRCISAEHYPKTRRVVEIMEQEGIRLP